MGKKSYRLCKFDQIDSPRLVIDHPNVIDTKNGTVQEVEAVTLEKGRIVHIGSASMCGDCTNHVDGTGKYLIPGLWDMHTHILDNGPLAFPMYLANGITGIRDMGSDITSLLTWDAYPKPMPRIVYTGPIIDGYTVIPLARLYVREPKDVDIQVDTVLHYGADMVKVHNNFPRDAYFALAKKCKEEGVSFVGHVPIEVSAFEAIEAGQKTIEHMIGVHRAVCSDPDALQQRMIDEHISGWDTLLFDCWAFEDLDKERFDKLATMMKEYRIYVPPTLSGFEKNLAAFDLNNPWCQYYPKQARVEMEEYNRMRYEDEELEKMINNLKQLIDVNRQLAKMLHDAGVALLCGTDNLWVPYHYEVSAFYGDTLHREFEIFSEIGISNAEILYIATVRAAEYLGLTDLMGTVDVGKVADLVLLDHNPLEDIRYTRSISGVFLNGEYYSKETLMAMQMPQ